MNDQRDIESRFITTVLHTIVEREKLNLELIDYSIDLLTMTITVNKVKDFSYETTKVVAALRGIANSMGWKFIDCPKASIFL